MKKALTKPKEEEEELPFSFSTNEVDEEKIKAHWQKIKEKIAPDAPTSANEEKSDQL